MSSIDKVVLVGANATKDLDDFAMKGEVEIAASPPASASAPGTKGQTVITTDYIYVCVATDTWKRVALSTWT